MFGLLPLFLPVEECNPLRSHHELSPHSQDSVRLLKSHRISVNTLRPSRLYHITGPPAHLNFIDFKQTAPSTSQNEISPGEKRGK